jgi:ATP-dependent RNA helicase DeaD
MSTNHFFTDYPLKPEILRAIDEIGYQNPTPIQQKTIPHILENANDVIGLAQTGTGKTAAFSLPILNNIDPEIFTIQALILCPTRELCMQIAADIEKYSQYLKSLKCAAIYGGASINNQIKLLKRNPQIIIGTPGRTLDLIKRKQLKLHELRYLVLDEADEMLSMGFQDDLNEILETSPKNKQTLLFSATFPGEIARISKKYLNNPTQISVVKKNESTAQVSHSYYMVHERDRYAALKRIIDITPHMYAIIFCRTRQETRDIATQLEQDGYNSDTLHGDLSQDARDQVTGRFKNKQFRLLIATDVAARGLDVKDLTHVINYNLPDETEVYVHRSGRTGRAGKLGESVCIINPKEIYKIRQIEKLTGKVMEHKTVPTVSDIFQKQLFVYLNKVEESVYDEQLDAFMPTIISKLEWMTKEEIIKKFMSVEFHRFTHYYKNAQDINMNHKESKHANDSKKDGQMSYVKFLINAGSAQKVTPEFLIRFLNKELRKKRFKIGKIDVHKHRTFFDVDEQIAEHIEGAFDEVSIGGHKVKAQRI